MAGGTPRLWPFCASQGGGGATWWLWRPSSGRSVLAGAGGRTLGRLHAPAVSFLRAPGLGRNYLAAGTPRPQPLFACRGGREDTRQAARPGCGCPAHAGAGEKLPGGCGAPAAALPCVPGREGGH